MEFVTVEEGAYGNCVTAGKARVGDEFVPRTRDDDGIVIAVPEERYSGGLDGL